jgi:hypothetical protein
MAINCKSTYVAAANWQLSGLTAMQFTWEFSCATTHFWSPVAWKNYTNLFYFHFWKLLIKICMKSSKTGISVLKTLLNFCRHLFIETYTSKYFVEFPKEFSITTYSVPKPDRRILSSWDQKRLICHAPEMELTLQLVWQLVFVRSIRMSHENGVQIPRPWERSEHDSIMICPVPKY